ncbi:HNH endonuclease [Candidatus Micrarchaeota archaeon]|nr:HNH endonuclease [Candidatus Micrarchaeota archaeon]
MKKFHPTYAETSGYRGSTQNKHRLSGSEAATLRNSVLVRDHHKCSYCNFHGEKWQEVGYVDGDSSNNKLNNLTTVCPMCNLILNSGLGCQIESIVELYKSSEYNQNKIVQITRKMRSNGKSDINIIRVLGLKDKVPFKRNKKYLSVLFAFVTSWKGSSGDVEEALRYGYIG